MGVSVFLNDFVSQMIETERGPGWLNGSGRIVTNLEEVIPFSMGVVPGIEKPFD